MIADGVESMDIDGSCLCGEVTWRAQIDPGDLDDPQVFSLRMGGCHQRDQPPPKFQLWCRSALPWSEDLEALPKMRTQGRPSAKGVGDP